MMSETRRTRRQKKLPSNVRLTSSALWLHFDGSMLSLTTQIEQWKEVLGVNASAFGLKRKFLEVEPEDGRAMKEAQQKYD